MTTRLTSDPLGAWQRLPADMFPWELSRHSVDGFRERLRPAVPPAAVRQELCRLLTGGATVCREPPSWAHLEDKHRKELFIVLADSVCLPLVRSRRAREEWTRVTYLVRGSLPPMIRAIRNRTRAARTTAARTKRRLPSSRPKASPSPDEWTAG